jgi:hypothetical protein
VRERVDWSFAGLRSAFLPENLVDKDLIVDKGCDDDLMVDKGSDK